MTSYPNSDAGTLSGSHGRMIYGDSGIDRRVAAERGVRTTRGGRDLPEGFSRRQRRRGGGLLFTVHRPNGETSYSFRPDATCPENPGHRYEQPCKALGAPGNVLDVHPSVRDLIDDVTVPVIFCEGIKKADSMLSAARRENVRVLVVAITGVWNWMSDGEAIADMFDIPVEGRRVTVMFDSDMLRNASVQDAARRLAEHLKGRGAEVFITYLPEKDDGSKMGADDFLAAGGGTLAELRMLTRRYDPRDFALVRLTRDKRLAAMISDLVRGFWSTEWKGQGGHTDRDTALMLIRAAAEHGRPVEGGVSVAKAWADLQLEVKVGPRTISKAIKRLQEIGFIVERVKGKTPDKRGGFVLKATARAGVYQVGTERDAERNVTNTLHSLYAATIHPRTPRLMWSSPGSKPRRGLVEDTRKVRQSPPPKPKPAIRRPGKIRGAVLDVLDAVERAGGTRTVGELSEALHRKRPRDLTRRKRPGSKGRDGLAIMLIDAGIVSLSEAGDTISLTADWRERLDDLRAAGQEITAESLARERMAEKREAYRDFLAERRGEKRQEREPTEAGRENVRGSRAKRAEHLAKVGTDPDPERDRGEASGREKRRARVERLVYEGMSRRWAEAEVCGAGRGSPPKPPPCEATRGRSLPPKVGGVYVHGPECACWICGDDLEASTGVGEGAA